MPFLQEYTMLDELGKGGFATVYKVRHNELGYIRAIRVLNETVVDASSPTYQKFLRECKVLLRLGNGNHPNIVHIYQPRLLDNKALVEMDYVDGQDIMHYLKQNKNFVPVEDVIRMATQMSSALAYCHEDIYRFCMNRDLDNLQDDPNDGSKVLLDDKTRQRLITKYKVIHNDIHSGNIMRREDGNFVLLDFGLAIEGEEVVRSSRRKDGAPEFKAPEKWEDESILTEQSDIYSFGVVLYEMMAGRVPFPFDKKNTNKTEAEYLLSKAHQQAPPPSIETLRKEFYEKKFEGQEYKKDYPQWIEDAILKCLQKNPADRFENGKKLYEYIAENNNKIVDGNGIRKEFVMKLEKLEVSNKELASEVETLREINKSLNMVLNEKQNKIVRMAQLLKEMKVSKEINNHQQSALLSTRQSLSGTNVIENKNLSHEQTGDFIAQGYVDLGLPSGTLWKSKNEEGFYTFDDAVRIYGSKLPTKEQLSELKVKCEWIWQGSGYNVVGPNGNFIYLPAAGFRDYSRGVNFVGERGWYWSSTRGSGVFSLLMTSSEIKLGDGASFVGGSVRLVSK